MNSRNIICKSFSLTVNQLVHFVFVWTLFAAASGMFAAREARGDTFTVTNTSDLGCLDLPCPGSLRRAILDANNNPGADTIMFNIPGSGVKTIILQNDLPSIDTGSVFIDGWSQSSERGYTGPPLIELKGSRLRISSDNNTVRGLIINSVVGAPGPGSGIFIRGDHNTIQGCYVGTTANGQGVSPNGGDGIVIFGDNNLIGGTTAGARNVISGNQRHGLYLGGTTSFGCTDENALGTNSRIEGNYIGISASGTLGLGNGERGVYIECGTGNMIGGTMPEARNVISGNGESGVTIHSFSGGNSVLGNYVGVRADGFTAQGNSDYGLVIAGEDNEIGGLPFGDIMRGNVISGNGKGGIKLTGFGSRNVIRGNHIGVGANGSTAVGNNGIGISVETGRDNQIGASGAILQPLGAGNIIRNNLLQGVRLGTGASTGNRISQNSIHANGIPTSLLGIDLVSGPGEGPLLNDDCDTDVGVNNLQNFPVINSALSFGGITTIVGTLNSVPDKTYTVEFFHSTTRDPSGFGEGRTYLGRRSITINASGCSAPFNVSFSDPVVPGHFITATATDPDGNTSEFSQSLAVAASTLQFTAASYNATENGGNATITVTRTGSTISAANVNYVTSNGTATAGQDYAAASGTLSFDIGETSKTFTVPVLDDGVFEGNETVNLGLINVTGAGAALGLPSIAVLTIVEDEPQPTLRINDISLTEGNSGSKTFAFTVSLSGPNAQTVSVTYATADGTATGGSDYQAAGATLTYTTGQTNKTVNVVVSGDTMGEPNETFFVNLTNPTNAPIADGQGLGTILNDDTCINSINPTVVNAAAVGGTGSVSVTSGCAWTAVSNDNWITVTSGSPGSGNGTVGYSVSANTGAARVGTITIAGQTFTVNQDGTAPTPTPSPTPVSVTTSPGTNVNVQGNGVSVTFSEVTAGGTTTIAPIDPNSTGTTPSGYAIFGSSVAFQITTTAGITPPIDLCFNVSTVNDPVIFGNLRVLHNENGFLVDRTLSHDFPTRIVCARTTTLSPFLVVQATQNPIDGTDLFVTQHYRDFLSREPDASGLQFWTNEIDVCGTDLPCREVKRINTSAAYFLSIEFQETGFLVYRFFKAAYGDSTSPGVSGTVPVIRRQEFQPDTERISQCVQVGIGDWQQQLESNKQAYALEFVQRQRFLDAFPLSLTPTQFVDGLNTEAGGVLSAAEADQLIAELTANNTATGRAAAVRRVAEDSTLRQAEFNRAFVLMQYFGYLRRNPDEGPDPNFAGWKFWLGKLDQFQGNFIEAEMVKAFISSFEYRERFFAQP